MFKCIVKDIKSEVDNHSALSYASTLSEVLDGNLRWDESYISQMKIMSNIVISFEDLANMILAVHDPFFTCR